MDKGELDAASKYFECVDLLANIRVNSFVIGRYSLWPFYLDQRREIEANHAVLINDINQNKYIADLGNYVLDLGDLTPKTWTNIEYLPEGKYVLKGETNSRKQQWLTSMFAPDKKSAIEIQGRLMNDGLIGEQKIYIRQYVPLFKYIDGIGGMPVTKEFRFFVAYGQILSGGFYWQNYLEDLDNIPNVGEVPKEFLQKVIDKVGNKSNFYVIDVAQTELGEWIVIELNDAQFSGLSCNDPNLLYKNLYNVLREKL